MRQFLILLLSSISFCITSGQSVIRGVVRDSLNHPVPYASIYLNNTTSGTISDSSGRFSLTVFQEGAYELIASCIGYNTQIRSVFINNADQVVNIRLSIKPVNLAEVIVKEKSRNRMTNYKYFLDLFIGYSPNAAQCRVKNLKDLRLYGKYLGNINRGYSVEPLVIENRALGYFIYFDLMDFSYDAESGMLKFSGKQRFIEMTGSKKQQAVWERNRKTTYEGSSLQFLRMLYFNTANEQGYSLSKIEKNFLGNHQEIVIKEDQIITNTQQDYKQLYSEESIKVDYTKIIPVKQPKLKFEKKVEQTFIQFKDTLTLYQNGHYESPYTIMFSGVMGKERVADLLPYDYMQEDFDKTGIPENSLKYMDSINQFLVSPYKKHHLIPRELIYTHFNKSDYLAGDNVWFTNYILDINQKLLNNTIQNLFVELIDPNGTITDKKMLPVHNGIAFGSFKIPENTASGKFSFRAYITPMNNQMAPGEYIVPIKVSGVDTDTETIHDSELKIQFYPESGTMLSGSWNKIGIKVTRTDGAGLPLNIDILDSGNKIKSSTSLNNYGMGEFTLLPKPDSVYHAKFYLPDGTVKLCKLPQSVNTGIVIGVNENLKKKVAIVINSNKQTVNEEQTFYVVIHNSGTISKVASINLTGSKPYISFIVPDTEISNGVNCITVFNSNFEPMAEKQFFKLTENLLGKIDISYNLKGDSIVFEISTADSTNTKIPARISLSVLPGENISDRFESSLYHEFLLLPAINGRIESSEFFLRSNSAFYRHSLNLLLLTQSKKYDWAQIKQSENITELYDLNNNIKSEQLPITGMLGQGEYSTAANFNDADSFQKSNSIYWKPDIVTTFSDKAIVTFKVPVETKSLKLRMEGFSDQGIFFLDQRTILLPPR